MTREISTQEFKEYCENTNPHEIVLYDKNQDWYDPCSSCRFHLMFDSIVVSTNPCALCLSVNNNKLTFQNIEHITIDRDLTVLGTVVDVVCSNMHNDMRKYSYKILMK